MHSKCLKHSKILNLPYNYIFRARSHCYLKKEQTYSDLTQIQRDLARFAKKKKCLVPTRTEEITPLSELYQLNSGYHCIWLVSNSCNILPGLLFGTQPHFHSKAHMSEQPAYAAPRQTNLQPLPLAPYSGFSCFIYSMHNVKGPISGVQREIWQDLTKFYQISPKSRPTT